VIKAETRKKREIGRKGIIKVKDQILHLKNNKILVIMIEMQCTTKRAKRNSIESQSNAIVDKSLATLQKNVKARGCQGI